jgi:copper(I)-binding protein
MLKSIGIWTLAASLTVMSFLVQAQEVKKGELTISGQFARFPGAMGGGFMTITNAGAADRLVAASSPVTPTMELHTHVREGDMMRMRKVDAIDVPAKGKVELKPGGFHVMFINVKDVPKVGATVPVTLRFEKAGDVTVNVPVREPGHGGHKGAHE